MELYNSKLILIIRSFKRKEMTKFGEFIRSPYFNKNKPVIRLYSELNIHFPQFNKRNFSVENLFSGVFPGEKYNYHKISNVISDLYKLAEQFLAQKRIESEDFYIERKILKELRSRELYKIYEQKHSSYLKQIVNSRFKDEEHFFRLYELTDEYLWYATIKKPNAELNILQTEFDHYINYILIRLLRFYNLMIHEKNQNNVNYNLKLFDEILNYVKNNDSKIPVLEIFKTILLLLNTKERKYYDILWKLKEKYSEQLRFDDNYLVYVHLYDFAAYMVNFKGEDSYNRDMFRIYKEMIDKRYMTPENFLYPNLMNVVKIACRVNEFEYAEKIIEAFEHYFPPDEKNNIITFCMGTIEYSKGNLRKAMKQFSMTNFQNYIFKVQVKILLLKIYYKLNMLEEALLLIDAFRHFLSREQNLLKEHRDSYTIFLNVMIELIKTKNSGNKKDSKLKLHKMKTIAEKMPANPFRIRVWLLEELS